MHAVPETNLSGRASDHAILSTIRVFATREPECQVCAIRYLETRLDPDFSKNFILLKI